jgi:exopolysaccharide biosynthesis protein
VALFEICQKMVFSSQKVSLNTLCTESDTKAYNLDGSGSSTMVLMSRVVIIPTGKTRERGTIDILMMAL